MRLCFWATNYCWHNFFWMSWVSPGEWLITWWAQTSPSSRASLRTLCLKSSLKSLFLFIDFPMAIVDTFVYFFTTSQLLWIYFGCLETCNDLQLFAPTLAFASRKTLRHFAKCNLRWSISLVYLKETYEEDKSISCNVIRE